MKKSKNEVEFVEFKECYSSGCWKLMCFVFRAKNGFAYGTLKIVSSVNNLYAKSVISVIFAAL